MYKDLCLSKKEREEKLLQVAIQSTNGLKARLGAKKADSTELTVASQENAIKKALDKRFGKPLDFDIFKTSCPSIWLKRALVYLN